VDRPAADADARHDDDVNLRRLILNQRALLCLAVFIGTTRMAWADGGLPRVSEQAGGYRVSVFTSPMPFRAGLVDISMLVQDADSGELLPSVQVIVRATPRDRPNQSVTHPATAEAATNKLCRAAMFELPGPGWWDFELEIEGDRGPARVRFALEAADRLPEWWALAPWIGWPALAIGLFSVHQVLVRRKPPGNRRL
jgi:hypothetical protein